MMGGKPPREWTPAELDELRGTVQAVADRIESVVAGMRKAGMPALKLQADRIKNQYVRELNIWTRKTLLPTADIQIEDFKGRSPQKPRKKVR